MIFNPNTNPTEVSFVNDESDGQIIRIDQRQFGSDKISSVYISVNDMKEFLDTLEA